MIKPHVHVPYHKIGEYLSFIKKHQVNLEVYFSSRSLDSISKEDILSIKKELFYNPSLSIHAPFMDLSPGAVDSKVREVTIERFKQIFDIASILRPLVIVFHSGYEKWKYAHRIDIWLEESLKTWSIFLKIAKELNVKIAIENVFEDEPNNLLRLFERMGDGYFGYCFDTGHFNLFSRVRIEDWLNPLLPYLVEMHLHDNDKTFDSHLAIGEGNFDFGRLFEIIKGRDVLMTVEAHSPEGVLKSFEKIECYLRNFTR